MPQTPDKFYLHRICTDAPYRIKELEDSSVKITQTKMRKGIKSLKK